MFRRFLLTAVVSLFTIPAFAQTTCDLQLVASCQNGVNGAPTSCTATTTNAGSTACTGTIITEWIAADSMSDSDEPSSIKFTSPSNSLGLSDCLSGDDSNEYGDITGIAFCFGDGTLAPGQTFTSTVNVSGATAAVPIIALSAVENIDTDEVYGIAYAIVNADSPTCTPQIETPPVTLSGVAYTVKWTAISEPSTQYIIEESTSADFTSNVTQTQVNGLSKEFRHDGLTTSTTYYYRVRATNCSAGTPAYSTIAQTVVQAAIVTSPKNAEVTLPLGSTTPAQFQVHVDKPEGITAFSAHMDQPYLDVTPKSGTFTAAGVTFTITANPASLPAGASTGTLVIAPAQGLQSAVVAAATTPVNIPITVSLVTPVIPGAKSLPSPGSLIIPVVTHVNGASGQFLSDVRLTNANNAPVTYQVTLTPTRTDATKYSKVTQVTVDKSTTIALNDIAKNFFGYGATGAASDVGFGSLEIRPLNTSAMQTYASSRTYASTALGTFGQFIAAMPFTKFATQRLSGLPLPGGDAVASTSLSLQQVAQSPAFRTNLGIVEGAGEPAWGRILVFDDAGNLLKDPIPYSLMPGEHQQLNQFISNNAGISNLVDGRIEITVDSPTGAVTAYASVLDNVTTDPFAVMPVDATKVSATRYVLPGMADLGGANNFHSDIRVFNGGQADVVVNFTYYPQGNQPAVQAQPQTIRKGQIFSVDNVLPTLFHVNGTGGSIVVTTTDSSSLVATGRTYTNVDGGGTYGQFIPGVTPSQAIGKGDTPLQVLQLEESDRFRSNLGLAEVSGQPATVKISVTFADAKATASTLVPLRPNEFQQLGKVITRFVGEGPQTYNARITVEVIDGGGRVTAYGSVIDNASKDPTYVPAQ